MIRILISGASGFVGTAVASYFIKKKVHVTGLGTSKRHPSIPEGEYFNWVSCDTTLAGEWQTQVSSADVIINVTGRNIFRVWTKKYKQAIYDSRILTTQNIVQAIGENSGQTLLSTSAVGIYGDGKEQILTEAHPPGSGFLCKVCTDWEQEALTAAKNGVRVSVMRFGVVLGRGGALSKMLPAFKLFAGGPLGSGSQWFPWIHIQDLVNAVDFLVHNKDAHGIFNFTAPSPVRQKDFAAALGRAVNRPSFFPAPSFLIKSVMGELGQAFLESQRAIPENLARLGYEFSHIEIGAALNDILRE